MITDASRVPLSARAWIADGVRGALVAADGTIDWYCPDSFTGSPALWSLLDPGGAAVRVGARHEGPGTTRHLGRSRQAYRERSNIAETIIEGPAGTRVLVTDFLPWEGPNQLPSGPVVRLVRALSGPVDVEIEVVPAGPWRPARDVSASSDGLVFDGIAVRTGTELGPLPLGRDRVRWQGTRRMQAGETLVVTVGPAGPDAALTVDAAFRLADDTAAAWRSWLGPAAYGGPYQAAVERSLLAVRSLIGAGGSPAASGTTSLSRRIGSQRTADGRWHRLRDAASATMVLAAAGLTEDAEASEAWLRRAVEAAPLPWPTALDADGQPAAGLAELSLDGWRRGQPVVTGLADGLTDLGLYADVVAAVGASMRGPSRRSDERGRRSDDPGWRSEDAGPLSAAWPALVEGADWVADHWSEPDAGRWEAFRPAQLVASRVEAWWALDRMVRLARARNPLDLDAVGWHQEAHRVLTWLEAHAVAADGGLMRVGGGDPTGRADADAALLQVAWRGPWPTAHPVVRATVDRVLERLGSGPFLHRQSDPAEDSTFGPDNPDLLATLWAVKALVVLDRWDEAHERIEAVVALGGSLGLLSETVDPLSGELTGNLPSAAVHLALVDAAMDLGRGPR